MNFPRDPFDGLGASGKALRIAMEEHERLKSLMAPSAVMVALQRQAEFDKLTGLSGIEAMLADNAVLRAWHRNGRGLYPGHEDKVDALQQAMLRAQYPLGLEQLGSIAKFAEFTDIGAGLRNLVNNSLWPERQLHRLLGISPRHSGWESIADAARWYDNIASTLQASRLFADAVLTQSVTTELSRLEAFRHEMDRAMGHGSHSWTEAMQMAARYGDKLPFISSPVAMALAERWQHDGLSDPMASIYEQLQALLDRDDEQDEKLADLAEEMRHFAKKQRGMSPSDILSILLTLLIFFYQEHSSEETEKRLTAKLDAAAVAQADGQRQVERMEKLLADVLQKLDAPPREATIYVGRDRPATIRERPAHGAPVVGRILPNQQATLVGEDRQWIEVEYFDFREQDTRRGWALKKYLKRQPARGKPQAQGPAQP